jgi:hypothetical protein
MLLIAPTDVERVSLRPRVTWPPSRVRFVPGTCGPAGGAARTRIGMSVSRACEAPDAVKQPYPAPAKPTPSRYHGCRFPGCTYTALDVGGILVHK